MQGGGPDAQSPEARELVAQEAHQVADSCGIAGRSLHLIDEGAYRGTGRFGQTSASYRAPYRWVTTAADALRLGGAGALAMA